MGANLDTTEIYLRILTLENVDKLECLSLETGFRLVYYYARPGAYPESKAP
jgi:hypothetical protein